MSGDGGAHARVDVEGGVMVVTLDRPDVLNAFSARMGEELAAAYAAADADDAVRAVVLTGAGRAFCAGADMTSGAGTFSTGESRPFTTASPVSPAAWDVRKPVIAAINGAAIGIGMTLAMQCDIRFAAADAKLSVIQVRRGMMPDAQSHWSVPRAVGFAVAAELFLTGRRFSGEEAVAYGLASRALPADDVLPAALDLAREIATETAPVSVAASKWLLWQDPGRDEAERLETALHRVLFALEDCREGPMAWLERRPPRWTGSVRRDWPADLA